MENYKIKVTTEAESKEAQDLFEQLGFKWAGDHPKNDDWYSHLYAENSTCCYLSPYVWNGLGDKFQELTLPQLRELVAAHRKPTEQDLISRADAKLAWAKGEELEFRNQKDKWYENWTNIYDAKNGFSIQEFDDTNYEFRLKPRTITLNVEIPAPFEPKDGDCVWFICDDNDFGYAKSESYGDDIKSFYGWWRTESEIKQVVAALRGAIKNG